MPKSGKPTSAKRPRAKSRATKSADSRRRSTHIVPRFLSLEEMIEALQAGHRADLFVGGFVEHHSSTMVLIRGNLQSIRVPLSWFDDPRVGPHDWEQFGLIDYGNTICLGDYEVAADAILEDFGDLPDRRAKHG